MRRSRLRALAEHLDVPVVALKHAPSCPHAGRVYASQCSCKRQLEEVPRASLDAFAAEEERLARLATN
jgi:hypothetical protein